MRRFRHSETKNPPGRVECSEAILCLLGSMRCIPCCHRTQDDHERLEVIGQWVVSNVLRQSLGFWSQVPQSYAGSSFGYLFRTKICNLYPGRVNIPTEMSEFWRTLAKRPPVTVGSVRSPTKWFNRLGHAIWSGCSCIIFVTGRPGTGCPSTVPGS